MTKVRFDQADLEAALTDGNKITRAVARFAASEAAEKLAEHLGAEALRPEFSGSGKIELMHAMAIVFVKMHAGFASNFLRSGAGDHVANLFAIAVKSDYTQNFEAALLARKLHNMPAAGGKQ